MLNKRTYYSSRNNKKIMDVNQLYKQLQSLFIVYKGKEYFKEKLGIRSFDIPEDANHKAMFEIKFMPFPIDKWDRLDVTDENIFDTLEFLFHYASKPGELVWFSDNGFNYQDYDGYDESNGKAEFKDAINLLICDYGDGFEISDVGEILSLGKNGLEEILDAGIVPYDLDKVDSKVKEAIRKWRNRNQTFDDRKQAIIDLANVFEWLKKTGKLESVLDRKDDSALFEIANKFEIRHHNPEQKGNYDKDIWYSWMFHFYLSTYHAVIRMLKKQEESK